MLKTTAVAVLVSLSLFASYWVGSVTTQAHDTLFNNVCLLDRANVSLLEQSLAETVPQDAKTFGVARLEKSRRLTIHFIERYRDIAPCEIHIRIPPRSF